MLRGYEDRNGLVFEVEDDGIGMDEAELAAVRAKLTLEPEEELAPIGSGGLGYIMWCSGFRCIMAIRLRSWLNLKRISAPALRFIWEIKKNHNFFEKNCNFLKTYPEKHRKRQTSQKNNIPFSKDAPYP